MTAAEQLRQPEEYLWRATDQLRENISLATSQYSIPDFGLRCADVRFSQVGKKLEGNSSGRQEVGEANHQAEGVLYLPDAGCFSSLKAFPGGSNAVPVINEVTEEIEIDNADLVGVLPRDYGRFENSVVAGLLRCAGSWDRDRQAPRLS